MKFFLGIDGGQSSTVAALGDESGRVLARANGPPADLVGAPRDSDRQVLILDAVIRDALANADLSAQTELETVVVGLSGYEPAVSAPIRLREAHVRRQQVLHDAVIAHVGAFDGKPGILVLAGTGSVVFGTDERGNQVRIGGWGYVFGDEGSAFRIAQCALSEAMLLEDRGRPSTVGARALAFFAVDSMRGVQLGFAHGEISRARIAAFSQEVLALAGSEGEEDASSARACVDEAVDSLIVQAALAKERLSASAGSRFSYAGGLFSNDLFRARFTTELVRSFDEVELQPPLHPPEVGALLLATRLS